MNFTFRFRDSLAAILFIISFTSFNSVSAGTFTVFGPEFFQRDAGAPVVTVAENFPVFNPNTTFTLKLNNNLVSSAIVLVNNTEILGPSDFSQQVQLLTRTVLLNTSNQLSAELNGEPGNNFTIEIVGIDNDLPLITATVTPQPASNGWNTTTPVTVSFECSDAISGIKDCPVPVIVNKEGAGQVITATATDNAGNSTPISIVLNIDKTAPTLNIVLPAPGSVLSTNPPQITVEYSDNVAIDPSSLMFSVDGQTMQVTCQATSTGSQCTPAAAFTTATVDITVFVKDMAGNNTSAQASYVIDSDNDGVPDVSDLCPNTAQGDPADTVGCPASQSDLDNDGQINDNDVFPLDPKEWADLDKDGIGDNSDPDIDGDGVVNESDAYPADPTRTRLPIVKITSPSTLTTVGSSPVEVKGSVDTAGTLTVNGVVITPVDGLYTANVALEEGHNTVVTRLVAAGGVISTASISVSLDLTPPYVTVESHKEGQIIRTPTVAISGLVNDIVRGTVEGSQANVTVNGVQATISNRSYLAVDIPLVEGENIISIVAADQVGNSATKTVTLTYQPTVGKHLELVDGQGQTALIKEILAQPLSIKVLDDVNQPVANKNVVFRVTQGSGILGVDTALAGRGVVVKTDAAGIASTKFQLGQRSGTGNHKVRARVVGYDDEIIFYASATANIGDKLSVNSGNNQRGGTHQPLPAPFVIAVTDAGTNVVKGARVRFDVINGGGHFENDNQTLTVVTDSDGRASAHYSLGGITGLDKQTVTATLLDGPVGQNITAGFSASGFTPGPAGATSISGIVVDNQDKPIPGITIRVDGTTRQAVADQSGQFKITEVPVGPVHLIADGSTATVEGEFPSLSYNIVTVSGVNNPLASPIFMVKLNTANAVYAGLEDVEITLAEVPGFKLEIAAGSVTFPDGSKEGQLSVTAVNANKVPMPAPNGMQPQLIVTIQPTGATFDPPAPLTLPNVDAHTPGAQVEMFSYDHDLEEFVAIGLGTVSEDGRLIKTNTGIGVIKAGWHCGAQPGGDGCCSGPSECNDYCSKPNAGCNAGCSIDESKPLEEQVSGDCSTATCGGSEEDQGDTPEDNPNDCVDEVCVGPPVPDDGETPTQDCTECKGGSPQAITEHVQKREQKPNDCLVLFCDGNNDDAPTEEAPTQSPDNCQKELCDGSTEIDDSDDPNEECKSCQSGKLEIDQGKALPDAKQLKGDCQVLQCDGTTKVDESDDPIVDDKEGDCKMPICEEPGFTYNSGDEPVDQAGDCRKPAGCTVGTVNGGLYVEPSFELDQTDYPAGSDLTDSVPNDCRKPGCTYDGFSPTGQINLADEPEGVCSTCSATGYPMDLDGVAVLGEACQVCTNGVAKYVADGTEIDQCNICVNGKRQAQAGKVLTQCTYCDGAGGVVKRDGPVGTGADCVTCSNGEVISSSCDTATITLIDKRDNNTIVNGETVKIGPEPSMPKFEATVDYGTGIVPESVQWILDSKHPRRPRAGLRLCHDENVDDKTFQVTLNPSASWNIYNDFNIFNSFNFFGAADINNPGANNATVSATGASSVSFNIHGENPLRSKVRNYIDSLVNPHDYIWKMALHESGTPSSSTTVRQFNPPGTTSYSYTPNFGGPDGWGIMQNDRNKVGDKYCTANNPTNLEPVLTQWIWNWKENVSEGNRLAKFKTTDMLRLLSIIRNHYKSTGSGTWLEPPTITDITGDLSMNSLQACGVQYYNGMQSYLRQGGVFFCLIFDQTVADAGGSADVAWSFMANENNYVEKILRTQE